MARKLPFLYLLLFLAALVPRPALAVTRSHITFEEPTHHVGSAPSHGSGFDQVNSIPFGSPTVVTDPSIAANQVLALRAGGVYSQIAIAGDTVLGDRYQLEFDVFTQAMSGSGYGLSVLLDTPEVRTIDLHGPLQRIYTFNPFQTGGATFLPFADNTPYHFRVEVDIPANLWVVTVNGIEICRQPFNARELSSIRFSVSPNHGNTPVETEPCAYVDNIKLTDNTVNNAPIFTKGSDAWVFEDGGARTINAWATGINAGSIDERDQLLDFRVSNNNPDLFTVPPAIAFDGTLTFTPAPNATGQATVTVQLHDDGGTTGGNLDLSAAQTFLLTIYPVNDAPTLDALPSLTVLEDAAEQSVSLSGITSGAWNETQFLRVTVTSSHPGLIPSPQISYISPASMGTLRFTPLPAATGTATITVTVNDGGSPNRTIIRDFTVGVLPVNHPPVFTKGPDLLVLEDSGTQNVVGWATGISAGPGDEVLEALQFNISTDAPFLFSAGPTISANGELTFTPAPNANGVARVSVLLQDDGGTANGSSDKSAAQEFTIAINPVNDAPSFVQAPEVCAAQDAGPQTLTNWATPILHGPANEAGQIVHFTISTSRPELFLTPPAISPEGTLTFSPKPDASGTTLVTVQLLDDGSSTAPDVNQSEPQTFLLHVTSILGTTGTYNALMQPATGAPKENSRAGLLALTISDGGRFTGKLTLRGKVRVLRGVFDNAGVARFGQSRSPKYLLPLPSQRGLELSLQVDLTPGSYKLTGSLTEDGVPYAELAGDRALFTNKTPVPPFQNVPPEILGSYTVIFAAKSPEDQVLPLVQFPPGDGIGRLTVSRRGVARLTGRLADGTGFTYANSISLDHQWPFYVALSQGKGSISGPAIFRDRVGLSDLDAQNIYWFKQAGQRPAYGAGWPNGIKVDLLGSKYDGVAFPSLAPADADGNLQLILSNRTLPSSLKKAINFSSPNTFAVVQYGSDQLHLNARRHLGLISGTFRLPGAQRSYPLRAVFFPKQSAAFGFFLQLHQAGSVRLVPSEHPVTSQ